MPVTTTKVKRRRKHCPVCEEEVSMSVVRAAESDNDLWWLLCAACDSNFALISKEYQRNKKPDMSAIERVDATEYQTKQTYDIGDLLYHGKMEDIGLVVEKISSPIAQCSGAIVVSFMESGEKTLIEGYIAG